MSTGDRPTWGRRISNRLVHVFGPAQVGRLDADGRGVSAAERQREDALRSRFERVTGPDGRSYVVEHRD